MRRIATNKNIREKYFIFMVYIISKKKKKIKYNDKYMNKKNEK